MTLSKEHKHECDMAIALLKEQRLAKPVLKARIKMLDKIRVDENGTTPAERVEIADYLKAGIKTLPEQYQLRAEHILFERLLSEEVTEQLDHLPDDVKKILLALRTAKWYAENPMPEIEWIIEGVLEEGALLSLYGDSGIGKTFMAMHMADCIGTGKNWYGHKSHKNKVLYIDNENGDALMHRLSRIINSDGDADICYSISPGFILNDGGLLLLESLILAIQAKVVVLDPLMYFTDGDENSIEDMRPQFMGLNQLAKRVGCAFALVHHENRSGTYRGTSALKDASTLMLHLEVDDTPTEFRHTLKFTPEKQRQTMLSKFTIVWDTRDNELVTGLLDKMAESPTQAIVKAVLVLKEENEVWPGKDELVKAKNLHGLTRNQATETLAQAIKDHKLATATGGHNKIVIRLPEHKFP